ncbi:MAG TPA: addiction module protein [Myxococcota bacterium]|nr:addiction module protein [Myxococcota bacterium]
MDLEAQALRLPAAERARLIESLIRSLETTSDDESAELWGEEAERRAEELLDRPELAQPASEVLARARALVR